MNDEKQAGAEEMRDGAAVMVRLGGEEAGVWHRGTVVRARKQWVQLDDADEFAPFIADECNIVEWKDA